jgi:hypothetical protein
LSRPEFVAPVREKSMFDNKVVPTEIKNFASPDEEPVFILNAHQLAAIIEKAIDPLRRELEETREEVARERAYDRKRLATLEHPASAPGKTSTERVQKIIRYMSARPDHKADLETLRGHLGVNSDVLSHTLTDLVTLCPNRYKIELIPGQKRKKRLVEIMIIR